MTQALGMRAPARPDVALEICTSTWNPRAEVREEREAKQGGRGRGETVSPAIPPASAISSLPLPFSKCSFTPVPLIQTSRISAYHISVCASRFKEYHLFHVN